MTIEEKAKAYDEALKVLHKYDGANIMFTQDLKEEMFPELKESEDERIRKELLEHCKNQAKPYLQTGNKCPQIQSWIAWLEKQSNEPKWCHHKVDLSNCSEEYCKAYYDGWNNCNLQHSQCRSELDDVVKCLINGMKFYYEDNKEATWGTDKWSMPVKHIIEVLERQAEQKPTDKVEPKFKVGDVIGHKNSDDSYKIIDIINDKYYLCENNHMWDVESQEYFEIKSEQKPAWSEENKKLWVHDDDILLDAAKMIVEDSPRKSYGGVHNKEIVPWFYSLKERLKSLKPQNTWKPDGLDQLYTLY